MSRPELVSSDIFDVEAVQDLYNKERCPVVASSLMTTSKSESEVKEPDVKSESQEPAVDPAEAEEVVKRLQLELAASVGPKELDRAAKEEAPSNSSLLFLIGNLCCASLPWPGQAVVHIVKLFPRLVLSETSATMDSLTNPTLSHDTLVKVKEHCHQRQGLELTASAIQGRKLEPAKQLPEPGLASGRPPDLRQRQGQG